MKRLLIISPHFPPTNAADMQRVRMSLPYFEQYNWQVEVVVVDENYIDQSKDQLLIDSLPENIIIHKVKALSKKWTSKIGLGSLALRSMLFYRNKVNALLRQQKFDLIYFSTTQFPICILGTYWKRKFKIPFVIDMQDPWHSNYYQDKPKKERPKKYWFSYRLNKFLEPIAIKNVDGLISVSKNYIETLQHRYQNLKDKPTAVITFGAFDIDFKIAREHDSELKIAYENNPDLINLVYIGRGGYDMKDAIKLLFSCFKKGLENNFDLFHKIRFHFIGTSYAANGTGIKTILPLAEEMEIALYVSENTDRIGFYQSLKNLNAADGIFIMGSNDTAYTASKLYPYILADKSLLSLFHPKSSACNIIRNCNAGELITLEDNLATAFKIFEGYIQNILKNIPSNTNWKAFEGYTSKALTAQQVQIFNQVILDTNHT